MVANQVRANFDRYGLLDDRVRFLEGWFADTLPMAPIEQLAVLRLDGDLYESTMDASCRSTRRSPPVASSSSTTTAPGNPAEGRRRLPAQHGITDEIVEVDWTGIFWRRS